MALERGTVWWGPALHKRDPAYRPWVVVSDSSHPFSEVECIALAMTTRRHAGSVDVPHRAWRRGGSEKRSYISPWYVATIKHRDLDRQQGTLTDSVLRKAVSALHRYTPLPDG